MKLILTFALLFTTAALAKEDCKARCSAVRTQCVAACQDPGGAGKTKKGAAECAKKMCEMAVQQCEGQCGGNSGKNN